jgi:hypothetical protein
LSALLNWFKLVCGPFWLCNMNRPEQPGKNQF